ncbi:hypothetical protein [Nesterenkonia sp. F]|uniref:hypothetical protein n=1 Tax=Nesterenkonia sp. F TaxID=795955 RepID=UPI000255D554|nr:hypothetical protein [Nesterenkonia sp. F]
MTAETASQPEASGTSPADDAEARQPAAAPAETPETRTQDGTHEVVMALLTQQEALLAELRWAYDELERTQEVEIVQLKSRLARLEEQAGLASDVPGASASSASTGSSGSSGSSGSAAVSSFAARTRRRVELSVQDPDRAVREAGRRLRRPIGRIARRAGISR